MLAFLYGKQGSTFTLLNSITVTSSDILRRERTLCLCTEWTHCWCLIKCCAGILCFYISSQNTCWVSLVRYQWLKVIKTISFWGLRKRKSRASRCYIRVHTYDHLLNSKGRCCWSLKRRKIRGERGERRKRRGKEYLETSLSHLLLVQHGDWTCPRTGRSNGDDGGCWFLENLDPEGRHNTDSAPENMFWLRVGAPMHPSLVTPYGLGKWSCLILPSGRESKLF